MPELIYRVQGMDGRGPFKPGFSKKWIEDRPDHDNLLPWMVEFGAVHKMACTWENIGCGCLTIEQLRRWFTRTEYEKLLDYGYVAVKMQPSRILARSDIQCVFTRAVPLRHDVQPFMLYDEVER